jgi:hypothetical protein
MAARTIAGLVLGGLLVATGAAATELRAGGVLESSGEIVLLPGAPHGRSVAPALDSPDLRFGFTPRAGSSLLLDGGDASGGALDLRVGLAPASAGLGRLDGLGLATLGKPLGAPAGETGSGLAIGGALAWSGWTIGGAYATGVLPRSELDLWTGRLGYGPIAARLGYGQEVALGRAERELWLFGTDLAAGSWLTLEGDLAVTTQADREPTTVGRIGLRLNF